MRPVLSNDSLTPEFGRQVAVAFFPSESRHLSWESRVMNREACVEVSKKDSDSNAAR